MTTVLIILGVLAGLAAIIAIGWAIHRHLYVKSLQEKGWHFETSPHLQITSGLNCPPFGIGFGRSVDDQIHGTTASGVPFNVFEYRQAGEDRIAALQLPFALPEAYVLVNAKRASIPLPQQTDQPVIHAERPDLAARIRAAIDGALREFVALDNRADLSIDGDHLVAVGMPAKADDLEARLEALAGIAQALVGGLADLALPAPARRVGFYRTDWTYADRDDSWLDRTVHTGGGQNHRAEDVVTGPNDGLPFVGYTHRWETVHTRTTTDSDGNSRTETYTVNHDEAILEVYANRPFGELSVNMKGRGEKIEFEGLGFNKQFKVRAMNRKFGYDVIHPRQMEFLTAYGAPYFCTDSQGRMSFQVGSNSPETIGYCINFAHGFFGRVPSFVWKDLGVLDVPAFREVTA